MVFIVGNLVSHDSLGDAVVLQPGREGDGFIQIEWSRSTGNGVKRKKVVQNRWVPVSSLHKLGHAPILAQPVQQGIFGNLPEPAAHERDRNIKLRRASASSLSLSICLVRRRVARSLIILKSHSCWLTTSAHLANTIHATRLATLLVTASHVRREQRLKYAICM